MRSCLSLAGETRSQRRARRPLWRRHLVERPLAGGNPRVRTAGIQTPAPKYAQYLGANFIVVHAQVCLYISTIVPSKSARVPTSLTWRVACNFA